MLFWRVPTAATSHRMARMGGYNRGRPLRSVRTFHVCHLNKQHIVSVAVGLSVITLLLVVFAYHGGYGIGSWFYTLLVVLSGLAFVVFGPLLLCRCLLHAYYRKLEARTMRLRATAQTQTGEPMLVPQAPHVYACIIITQEEDALAGSRGSTRLSDLPTYDEATAGLMDVPGGKVMVSPASFVIPPSEPSAEREYSKEETEGKSVETNNNDNLTGSGVLDGEDDSSPPPSYGEALAMISMRSVIGNTKRGKKTQQN